MTAPRDPAMLARAAHLASNRAHEIESERHERGHTMTAPGRRVSDERLAEFLAAVHESGCYVVADGQPNVPSTGALALDLLDARGELSRLLSIVEAPPQRPHVTHYDDCGCMAARHTKQIADANAAIWRLQAECDEWRKRVTRWHDALGDHSVRAEMREALTPAVKSRDERTGR